jgi:hypothetical protein
MRLTTDVTVPSTRDWTSKPQALKYRLTTELTVPGIRDWTLKASGFEIKVTLSNYIHLVYSCYYQAFRKMSFQLVTKCGVMI